MRMYRFNIWTEKFSIFDLKEDAIMDSKKSEFLEAVAEMSQFAGALVGAAVVAGKKVIRYLNDLAIVDTILKSPADAGEVQTTDSKISKTNMEVD